jgi:hypothetical protein
VNAAFRCVRVHICCGPPGHRVQRAVVLVATIHSLGFIFSDFPLFYGDTKDPVYESMIPKKDVGFVAATFYIVNSAGM